MAEFIREYITSEVLPFASEWEEAEQIPLSAYQRHAELGFIAASLGPKQKLARHLMSTTLKLPADIPLDEWDPFHDFVVRVSDNVIDCSVRMRSPD